MATTFEICLLVLFISKIIKLALSQIIKSAMFDTGLKNIPSKALRKLDWKWNLSRL